MGILKKIKEWRDPPPEKLKERQRKADEKVSYLKQKQSVQAKEEEARRLGRETGALRGVRESLRAVKGRATAKKPRRYFAERKPAAKPTKKAKGRRVAEPETRPGFDSLFAQNNDAMDLWAPKKKRKGGLEDLY